MTLITMYDATSPQNLPPVDGKSSTVALAGYCDLGFAGDWIAMVHKYPRLSSKQRIVSIAGSVATTARILDYELHNPTYGDPDAVAQWVLKMLSHGVFKPGAYADRSDMPAIQAAYVKHKVPRDKTVLWLAAPGADPTAFLNEGFDAVQHTFAGKYDVSVCKPEFFPGADPKPKPKSKVKHPKGTVHFLVSHKFGTSDWTIHKVPGTGRGGSREYFDSAEVQVNAKTLKGRVRHMGANAKPLGG